MNTKYKSTMAVRKALYACKKPNCTVKYKKEINTSAVRMMQNERVDADSLSTWLMHGNISPQDGTHLSLLLDRCTSGGSVASEYTATKPRER